METAQKPREFYGTPTIMNGREVDSKFEEFRVRLDTLRRAVAEGRMSLRVGQIRLAYVGKQIDELAAQMKLAGYFFWYDDRDARNVVPHE